MPSRNAKQTKLQFNNEGQTDAITKKREGQHDDEEPEQEHITVGQCKRTRTDFEITSDDDHLRAGLTTDDSTASLFSSDSCATSKNANANTDRDGHGPQELGKTEERTTDYPVINQLRSKQCLIHLSNWPLFPKLKKK